MPAAAEERLAEYARMWTERGIRAWGEGWWKMPMTVGDQIGRIVGAPAGLDGDAPERRRRRGDRALVLPPVDPARNRVVYERGNFPSVRYLYQAQPDLEVVVCEDDEAIVDAIDERTLLVPISHVLFKTGEIQDVEPIIRARARGRRARDPRLLPVGRDRARSTSPRSASTSRSAARSSGCAAGPATAGSTCGPTSPSGSSRRSRAGRRTSGRSRFEEEMEYAPGAARFLTGTPNVPALYAATAGYDLIEEVGVDRIRENSLRQTQLLIDLADAAGFEVASPREPERRGGTVTVHVPEFAAVHRELRERQILCDFRPDAGIRLGPHYYNTDDELRHAIAQIGEIVETGAYERHLGTVARH